MSLGYSGSAKKVNEDEKAVVYEYACCHIGRDGWNQAMNCFDGSISIEKDSFRSVESIGELLNEEKIRIINCSYAFKVYGTYDFMALKLLYKIVKSYKEEGTMPKEVSWDS